jgi:hypothetical protein
MSIDRGPEPSAASRVDHGHARACWLQPPPHRDHRAWAAETGVTPGSVVKHGDLDSGHGDLCVHAEGEPDHRELQQYWSGERSDSIIPLSIHFFRSNAEPNILLSPRSSLLIRLPIRSGDQLDRRTQIPAGLRLAAGGLESSRESGGLSAMARRLAIRLAGRAGFDPGRRRVL